VPGVVVAGAGVVEADVVGTDGDADGDPSGPAAEPHPVMTGRITASRSRSLRRPNRVGLIAASLSG
jgi:hypothetical protein